MNLCNIQAENTGNQNFGMDLVFINGFLDLNLHLVLFSKFGKRPMHLFGAIGVLNVYPLGFLDLHFYLGHRQKYSSTRLEGLSTDTSNNFYIALIAMVIVHRTF